ncbi:MAG TPA: sigma-70 family RNA polymerase sigma factor [Streptosporangiaceae bacterium]|jgi:RNA polymerase sigma-70 factor (ECF subfamily)|nr:sigma-70 family RNA polymerase sigma factor [Streptosporangiaceae bacterium]
MTEPVDDPALVLRARAGDTTAFEQLVRRHSGPVYRIALRITAEPEAARDAAQEAFIIAWRRLREIRAEQAFAVWLSRVATTCALRAARPQSSWVDIETSLAAASPTGDPQQQLLAADLLAALKRALKRLTPQQRACWVLRELEGLSYDQIAEVIGSKPAAVRGRIHRARTRLAKELRPWR